MSGVPGPGYGFDVASPSEEHRSLREMLARFVREEVEPQAEEHNRCEKLNLALFGRLGELGLFGVTIPGELGGAGMDATAVCIVCEELSTSDPGFALSYLAHELLFVNNFFRNSNDEQRGRYLGRVLTGEWIAGMCMTEPGAGTDVPGGMRCRARRDGEVYFLNGEKTFITNGYRDEHTTGDLFLVYAKTGDRLSSFLVERGTPGFSLGSRLRDKLGMRSSPTASLVFEDARVPVANRLGEEGDSLIHMMQNLELERLGLAAMSLGIARRCVRAMVSYAAQRKQFGKPISHFGQVQRHVAESFAEYRAARAYVYDVASRLHLEVPGQRLDCDGAKLVSATMAKNVADRAIQVHGGYGYMGEYVVERMWRDAKLLEIGGGTLEAHHKNITKDLTKALEADPTGCFL